MEVAILNREDTINFIKTYQDVYDWDQSDIAIKDHLVHGSWSDGVGLLYPFRVLKANTSKSCYVSGAEQCEHIQLCGLRDDGNTFYIKWLDKHECDKNHNWQPFWLVVSSCVFRKRICNTFKGRSNPFYECLFTRINLWLPLFEFDA